ncbi:hypothetical protein LEMLEM_LOCUS1645, partial [Lemmus lemmus]
MGPKHLVRHFCLHVQGFCMLYDPSSSLDTQKRTCLALSGPRVPSAPSHLSPPRHNY